MGRGQQAALDYLARYVFRIAITNNRILAVDDATVTYRYKDRATKRQRKETVSGHEFIRRFLQHVLPAGFPCAGGRRRGPCSDRSRSRRRPPGCGCW